MWMLLVIACEPVALHDLSQLQGYWEGSHQTALDDELCTSTDELLVNSDGARGIIGGDVCGADAAYAVCDLEIPRRAALLMTNCEYLTSTSTEILTATERSFDEVWFSTDTLYLDTLILRPSNVLLMEGSW